MEITKMSKEELMKYPIVTTKEKEYIEKLYVCDNPIRKYQDYWFKDFSQKHVNEIIEFDAQIYRLIYISTNAITENGFKLLKQYDNIHCICIEDIPKQEMKSIEKQVKQNAITRLKKSILHLKNIPLLSNQQR